MWITKGAVTANCTPFVRQYGILNNKWGAVHLTQEYFVYFKEKRRSMAEKDPPVGVLSIFKQALGLV